MLDQAVARGFRPKCVLFDGWYASLDNLKQVRRLGWTFLTRFASNRIWLRGFGEVRVFRVVCSRRQHATLGHQRLGHGGHDAVDTRRVELVD